MKRPASLASSHRQSNRSPYFDEKRIKLSHQINWRVDTLPLIPLCYIPNVTTSTVVRGLKSKDLTSRIIDVLFAISAVGDFHDGEARATIRTPDHLKFEIQMFQTSSEKSIMIEIQRIQGDVLQFHSIASFILQSLRRNETCKSDEKKRNLALFLPTRAPEVDMGENELSLAGRHAEDDEQQRFVEQLEYIHTLLGKDRKCAILLGLQSLLHMTDPHSSSNVVVSLSCRAILFGRHMDDASDQSDTIRSQKCHEINEHVFKILYQDEGDDDEHDYDSPYIVDSTRKRSVDHWIQTWVQNSKDARSVKVQCDNEKTQHKELHHPGNDNLSDEDHIDSRIQHVALCILANALHFMTSHSIELNTLKTVLLMWNDVDSSDDSSNRGNLQDLLCMLLLRIRNAASKPNHAYQAARSLLCLVKCSTKVKALAIDSGLTIDMLSQPYLIMPPATKEKVHVGADKFEHCNGETTCRHALLAETVLCLSEELHRVKAIRGDLSY